MPERTIDIYTDKASDSCDPESCDPDSSARQVIHAPQKKRPCQKRRNRHLQTAAYLRLMAFSCLISLSCIGVSLTFYLPSTEESLRERNESSRTDAQNDIPTFWQKSDINFESSERSFDSAQMDHLAT